MSLQRPADKGEREFIPCFDHKNRDWYGLRQQEVKTALARYGVLQHPYTEVVSLCRHNGAVTGALAVSGGELIQFCCKSCVIATGGLGGLFRYALTSSDVNGMGHLLAMEAGAQLVNLEFFQMMVGFVRPAHKTVHNEKVFRYSEFTDAKTGRSLFDDLPQAKTEQLLELRSRHGPFTSRLESKEVDSRIFRAFM